MEYTPSSRVFVQFVWPAEKVGVFMTCRQLAKKKGTPKRGGGHGSRKIQADRKKRGGGAV